MIVDSFDYIACYKGLHPNLDKAIDWLNSHTLDALENGKTIIDGENVFVNVMDADLRDADGAAFEYHRRYADLQIDLTGQVAAEAIGTVQWSGTGGATDYAYGAYHSRGGRAMLCQISTAKKGTISRIAPILDPGSIVSVSRNLTDMVITEYGVAKLRQRTVKQRVENLIAVAHPDFRAELRKEANKYMYF